MDATVPQTDGYRFIYVLPFGPRRLLIEDTHYSDAAGFDAAAYEGRGPRLCRDRGWRVASILRRERGALPITLDGDIDGLCADMAQWRASAFRPGSSIRPPAIRCRMPRSSRTIRRCSALDAASLPGIVQEHARALWRRRRLYRLLNRMLFHAARPEERHRVLSHFYRLPQPLVERFYGDRLTLL